MALLNRLSGAARTPVGWHLLHADNPQTANGACLKVGTVWYCILW